MASGGQRAGESMPATSGVFPRQKNIEGILSKDLFFDREIRIRRGNENGRRIRICNQAGGCVFLPEL